uniref:Uncharacterized protein n=1 Tax=Anguilla anguilla TaxID=7936 RepID=A0A0E9TIS3_ANGAN
MNLEETCQKNQSRPHQARFRHGDAEPPAVAKDKADNSGPDRQERTDRTELRKNREPKVT